MCQSCEVATINRVLCHEQGCPDAWRDYMKECSWCGQAFKPEDKYMVCCSEECLEIYNS